MVHIIPQPEQVEETSTSTTNTPIPSPIPPPIPVETHPNRIKPVQPRSPDPDRLAPEDALTPPRLRPIVPSLDGSVLSSTSAAARAAAAALRPAVASLRQPPAIPPIAARLEQERRAARAARKRSRQPHVWKKLLWVKQKGYPDNYTDPATFLERLERNPKLRPYEFWPLVADSMVIVQHVAALLVFVCAYAGIYQDRLSPVAVVVCGSFATVVAWIMWDQWKCQEEAEQVEKAKPRQAPIRLDGDIISRSANGRPLTAPGNVESSHAFSRKGMTLSLSTTNLAAKNAETGLHSHHGPSLSKSSFQSISPIDGMVEYGSFPTAEDIETPLDTPLSRVLTNTSQLSSTLYHYIPHSPTTLPQSVSPRNQARIKTFKSALLIYFALLGLSPILKSLTKSTSSDSIWALATWLLTINIFFFDYGSQYVPSKPRTMTPVQEGVPPLSTPVNGTLRPKLSHASFSTTASSRIPQSIVDVPAVLLPADTTSSSSTILPPQNTYPSSLSTNAALMASTVLASRLPTTTSVFSLTLFSIQIFGLFPLFRRHLRSQSFQLHTILTMALILLASAGLGLILTQSYTHTYGECGYCLGWCLHIFLKSMIGAVLGSTVTLVTMGGCAWWLISLQRYKDVVIGPWDPAKPMLAGGSRIVDGQ